MIECFSKYSKQYENLLTVARLLGVMADAQGIETMFYVQDVYFDYGAGMMWTTIIAERFNTGKNYRDSWQMLNPKQQEAIVNGTPSELFALTKELWDTQSKLMR